MTTNKDTLGASKSTMKSRFEEQFVKLTQPSTIGSTRFELVKAIRILNVRKPDAILAFFQNELELLAEEIENMKDKYEPAYGEENQALTFGLAEAAAIIRTHAKALN